MLRVSQPCKPTARSPASLPSIAHRIKYGQPTALAASLPPPSPPPPLTAPSPPGAAASPPVLAYTPRCFDNPEYEDSGYICSDFAETNCEDAIGVDLSRLMSNCPESCEDVTPVCSENTPPFRPYAPPQAPETGCINDPSYYDGGWTCDDWIGYSCRTGAAGVNTALLVRSCPIACVDVTRICKPPTAPPPPPGPPANPLFNNWPPPPPPPETGKCIADGIGREGGAFGVGLSAVGLLMIALLFVPRRAAPIRWGGIPLSPAG